MSSSPPDDASDQENSDGPSKVTPRDPGFKKIHQSITSHLSLGLYHAYEYPHGKIMTFSFVSPETGQQITNWYRRLLLSGQTNRLRLIYNPKHHTVHFKFSHPAGEAFTEAFATYVRNWTWNPFGNISKISKSILDDFRVLSHQLSPTTTPTRRNTPLLTPPLSLHPKYQARTTEFPTIIIDYTYSSTSSPAQLTRHWHDLYRIRDLWFSHSKGKTQVVILALFYIDEETNDNKVHGRMDVWRYDKQWRMGRLTDEVVLFPAPPDTASNKETISFTIQEVFGESCNFRFKESRIKEDMKFTLDIQQLRDKLKQQPPTLTFRSRRMPEVLFA